MLTRQGRLCWCVVFPAAPGRCEWCGQGREILKAGQAQSLWGRLGQVFKESLFSSRLRALGYTLLFCSQFSNYCELTNSLPIFFFFFPGCSAWFARTWFPNQGLNPGPQQLKCWVFTTELPGNSLFIIFSSRFQVKEQDKPLIHSFVICKFEALSYTYYVRYKVPQRVKIHIESQMGKTLEPLLVICPQTSTQPHPPDQNQTSDWTGQINLQLS